MTLHELKSNITIQGSVRIDSYDNDSEDITTIFETFDFENANFSDEILAKKLNICTRLALTKSPGFV